MSTQHTNPNRVPAGVRTGGQFSTGSKAEANVTLGDQPMRCEVIYPENVTKLRAALKNSKGERDPAVERLVVVDFDNAGKADSLDLVGPKDGRTLHVQHPSGFVPMHLRSGTANVHLGSRSGNSLTVHPGATAIVTTPRDRKVTVDALPGSTVTIDTSDDGDSTRVRIVQYEGSQVTVNTSEGGPQPSVLYFTRHHGNHPDNPLHPDHPDYRPSYGYTRDRERPVVYEDGPERMAAARLARDELAQAQAAFDEMKASGVFNEDTDNAYRLALRNRSAYYAIHDKYLEE